MIKKIGIFFTIIFLCVMNNVKAEECPFDVIKSSQEAIKNVSYKLEYNSEYTDMNGTPHEGYFNFTPINLPDGYHLSVIESTDTYYLSNADFCAIKGGIYEIVITNDSCDSTISSFQIKVPFYKQYCDLEKECKNIWYDGTNAINSSNTSNISSEKKRIDYKIIIVIVSILTIILITIIIVKVKRRKKL